MKVMSSSTLKNLTDTSPRSITLIGDLYTNNPTGRSVFVEIGSRLLIDIHSIISVEYHVSYYRSQEMYTIEIITINGSHQVSCGDNYKLYDWLRDLILRRCELPSGSVFQYKDESC